MKTNHILATGLLAGGLLFSIAKAQELIGVPIDSSLTQEQVLPQAADTAQATIDHIVKYTGADSLYDATPIRQTAVEGLTEKQIKAINKKYPDGIPINSNAFSLTVEDSIDVLEIIDAAAAYLQEVDSTLTLEQKNFMNYEAYRIRKTISETVAAFNDMAKKGRLTTQDLSNLLQPRYALSTADLNRLKETYPEDAYKSILSAVERFDGYLNNVTSTTQSAIAQALKTPWYKDWKFTVPASAALGTATYFIAKGKDGKEKVYNTGDWTNNTH